MRWNPFSEAVWSMMAFLWVGLDGKGPAAIHASKNGLRVVIHGVTVARGKDPDEVMRDYRKFVAKLEKEVLE